MDCYYSPTSTCLCGCDCEFPTICTAPVQTQSIPREPPHEPCCCCSYNPFADENNETEILDLGFARRKLTMMKCQMKKWRMERLQLESETRSLKQTLQSLGNCSKYLEISLMFFVVLRMLIIDRYKSGRFFEARSIDNSLSEREHPFGNDKRAIGGENPEPRGHTGGT